VKGRLEAGDLLAFLYALVLVREAFWLLPETVAWGLSFGVAALLGLLRLRTRRPRPPLPVDFWLGVAAPLGLFWALHLPYPDVGFDVLTYHIFHGERALRGLLVVPGDFYPYYFPFLNPAPDILAALLRHALGYRLGTVGSLLATVWTGALLYRILAPNIASPRLRALATLWIVCSEGILWEVGNYMVDLYGLPLLLEAALLALPDDDPAWSPLEELPRLGLLLGSAVAFKLTNLVFAVVIALVFFGRLLSRGRPLDRRRLALSLGTAAVSFLLPMAPHTLLLWQTTGSPLFPHYNAFFRSPLFPQVNIRDGRFGPPSALDAVVWPVVSAFRPGRLSELGRTSGRLALGYLGALLALVVRPRDRRLGALAVIVVAGSFLWSLGAGNHRYGLFLELCGGLIVVLLAAQAIAAASGKGPALRPVAWLLLAALGIQSILVLQCLRPGDWSGRPTAFYDPRSALRELLRVGSDRDLRKSLPPEIRNVLSTLGVWVEASPNTSGLMTLLAPRLPMIGLRLEGIFDIPANLARFDESIRVLQRRPLASLVLEDDLEAARTDLTRCGFVIRREQRFDLPFYSDFTRLGLVALELKAPKPRPPAQGRRIHIPEGLRQDNSLTGGLDDLPEQGVIRGPLFVKGWARIPGEDLDVRILIDGEEIPDVPVLRYSRPDVCAAIPEMRDCTNAGFEARFEADDWGEGRHEITALFFSRDGRYRMYPPARFTWTP